MEESREGEKRRGAIAKNLEPMEKERLFFFYNLKVMKFIYRRLYSFKWN